MARRASPKNGGKPEKQSQDAATIPNGPSDERVRHHFRQISTAKTALDEASAIYRGALKAAKADGIQQGEMIATLIARKKEPEAVGIALATRIRYHILMGIPVGTQLALFQPPSAAADDEQDDWEADASGYESGRTGGSANDNPHTAGSSGHAAWMRGYSRGQASIAKQMGKNAKVASTRRKRSEGQPTLVQ